MRNLGETLTPHRYEATFVRQGSLGKKKCALLIMLRDDKYHVLCDHLWVYYSHAMERLKAGDLITFTGTPFRYIKGYSGNNHVTSTFSVDVSLKDIKQIRTIGNNPVIARNINAYNSVKCDMV